MGVGVGGGPPGPASTTAEHTSEKTTKLKRKLNDFIFSVNYLIKTFLLTFSVDETILTM